MPLLVMSDTHGDSTVIERVRGFYPQMDAVIHCGDSELSYDHNVLKDVTIVRGNCDRDKHFPEEMVLSVDGAKVYVTHGHLYNVKQSILNLSYRAQEIEADIVLFGHSHELGAELVNGILLVNPGSLLLPRGRREKSFAMIEKSEANWVVTFYTDDNERIATHTFPIVEK